jgi:ferric-dicitrate binding protein FerR (iron transport regulator)
MTQNRFWNLLAKKLSGDAMPSEVAELEKLVREHPEWVYAAEPIERMWKQRSHSDVPDAELAFEHHIELLKKNEPGNIEMGPPIMESAPISHKTSKLRSILVLVGVLVSVAGLVWKFSHRKHPEPLAVRQDSEVSTSPGNKTRLVLPDSSIVWLNAGSRITYKEQFGITHRNTTLSGEAYFEVKKSSIPFTIHANHVEIKVLGTVFNVKSYPNDKTTETTLIDGQVEVSLDKRPGQKFILKPNEKLIVANNMEETAIPHATQKSEPMVVLGSLTHASDETIIETSWVKNKLIFQDESFEEMARKMERWYDVIIEIPSEKIARMRVTGTFEKETVKQALDALQIAFRFNYFIYQNKITITE